MSKPPLPVLLIGCLYIATGAIGLIYHLSEFPSHHSSSVDLVWIPLVRLLALVCGVYLLRGRPWARWLALIWIAYHVLLSAFHTWQQAVVHALLALVIAFALFRPSASRYFKRKSDPGYARL